MYLFPFSLIYILFSFAVAILVGRHKKIGFWFSLLACLCVTPLIGYIITELSGNKITKGCEWCGNKENEAEYCGICNKNEAGELRPE